MFLRILKFHTIDAIKWALRGTITWKEFLSWISKSVERYGVRRVDEQDGRQEKNEN